MYIEVRMKEARSRLNFGIMGTTIYIRFLKDLKGKETEYLFLDISKTIRISLVTSVLTLLVVTLSGSRAPE